MIPWLLPDNFDVRTWEYTRTTPESDSVGAVDDGYGSAHIPSGTSDEWFGPDYQRDLWKPQYVSNGSRPRWGRLNG